MFQWFLPDSSLWRRCVCHTWDWSPCPCPARGLPGWRTPPWCGPSTAGTAPAVWLGCSGQHSGPCSAEPGGGGRTMRMILVNLLISFCQDHNKTTWLCTSDLYKRSDHCVQQAAALSRPLLGRTAVQFECLSEEVRVETRCVWQLLVSVSAHCEDLI